MLHHNARRGRTRRFGSDGESSGRFVGDEGYAVALTALLLLPVLAFVSLGVDVGAWYARAQQLQKAADAAALAAAPLTPDPVATRNAAQTTLTKNGITCAPAGRVQCTFGAPAGSEIAYRVTLTDPDVEQYFSGTFRSNVSITRAATAERLRPVPMGSPNNYLGTNELIPTTSGNPPRENFWLAISGKCASKEQGDRRMTVTDANWQSGSTTYRTCRGTGTEVNTEHDPDGYTYVMNLAANHSGTVHLEVYDPTLCSAGPGENPTQYGGQRHQFRYRVRGQGSTPAAAPLLREWTPGNTDADCTTYANKWVTLYQFNNPAKGQYYLQIADPSGNTIDYNRNSQNFALRARYDGASTPAGSASAPATWAKCSTIVGSTNPAYRADCPQVHGYRDIGVYASVSGSASFYLASITNDYSGRELEVTLWDPGEGAQTIELLNPLGQAVNFKWESLDCGTPGVNPPSPGCNSPGYVNRLDVSGTGTQPGAYRASSSTFSDRPIRLTLPLPSDIAQAYGGQTWWKVRYTAGSGATDRTTWTVRVPGDPVRLIPTL